MNKSDLKLILILIIILALPLFILNNKKSGNIALVYYESKVILKIDLNIDKEYNVEGLNGNVKIVVKDSKIKVDEENSPKHLCSKKGYISREYETIICLPNKIIIKIEGNKLDGVVS